MIRAARSVLAVAPLNVSRAPVCSHLVPDQTESIGTGCRPFAAHARSDKGANSSNLRIDLLLLYDHTAHLQLAIFDRKGEASFDEVERVLAELFVAPAGQDLEV